MNWWNDRVDWLTSSDGQRIVTEAVIPFIAILVAGVLAAVIARGMAKRLLAERERETKAAAVTALITAARRAVEWSGLGTDERAHSAHLSDEADIRLRLLPVSGAELAASWAAHEIAAIRANSGTFRFQSEQTFSDVRDRLVAWQSKPSRAKKLFRDEVERWNAERAETDASRAPQAPGFVTSDEGTESTRASASAPSASAPAAAVPAAPASAPPAAEVQAAAPAAQPPAAATAQDAAVAAMEAPHEGVPVTMPVEPEPAATTSGESPFAKPASPIEPVAAGEDAAVAEVPDPAGRSTSPARTTTGMVTTPVVGSPTPSGSRPASDDGDDDDTTPADEGEPAYSAPVSAHQVRRRTTPDAN